MINDRIDAVTYNVLSCPFPQKSQKGERIQFVLSSVFRFEKA